MRKSITPLSLVALISFDASAEFDFFPSITTGFTTQEAKVAGENRRSIESFSIDPSLAVEYTGPTFTGRWSMSHLHLIRDADETNFKDDFNTYSYDGRLELIDSRLFLVANGNLDLRNLEPGDYLISDRFFNPESLSKTRTNDIALQLQASAFDWVDVESQISYADVDAEQQNLTSNNLNGSTYSSSATLTQGDNIKGAFFNLRGEFSKTENEGSALDSGRRQSDQTSRQLNALFNQSVFQDFGLVLRASEEAYKFDSVVNSDSSRNYESYGIGFSYAPSPNRYIALTANRGDRDDETENYVGANIRWAFSGRTRVSAEYGRRYYGDSGEFDFEYNTRSLRAAVKYAEQVTNFSRLTASNESLGLFVCPANSIAIADCYQPNTLNPTLEPGEVVTEFTDTIVEVSDEPILIKATSAVLGYQLTRFSAVLEFRYSNPFYEDSGREQLSYTTNLTASYKLGSRTNLSSTLSYIESFQRRGTNGIGRDFDDIIMRATGEIQYQINEQLSFDTEFRIVDRDSNVEDRNVTDRRITFKLTYNF